MSVSVINLDLYKNRELLPDGRLKVYMHNGYKGFCCKGKSCHNPKCVHGLLGTRWPGDEHFVYTDDKGNVLKCDKYGNTLC